MSEKIVLIDGNPVDGFNFTGPFEDREAAAAYAERVGVETDWWVSKIDTPEPAPMPEGYWEVMN